MSAEAGVRSLRLGRLHLLLWPRDVWGFALNFSGHCPCCYVCLMLGPLEVLVYK